MSRKTRRGTDFHPDPSSEHRNLEDEHPSKRRRVGDDGPSKSFRAQRNHDVDFADQSKLSRKTTTHTKSDRKNNPSSRIYSMRKLLDKGDLPPNIKIEKERELASLLFDQRKDKVAKERRQMISRYHMVRFFERKKAERKLKKLRKELEALTIDISDEDEDPVTGQDGQNSMEVKLNRNSKRQLKKLDKQIREAAVDLNYTLYSPLTEKYISIFPSERSAKNKEMEPSSMNDSDHALLSNYQREDLEANDLQQLGVTYLRDRSSLPPTWIQIEEMMYPSGDSKPRGEIAGLDINDKALKQKLELLRDADFNAAEQRLTDREVMRSKVYNTNDTNASSGRSKSNPKTRPLPLPPKPSAVPLSEGRINGHGPKDVNMQTNEYSDEDYDSGGVLLRHDHDDQSDNSDSDGDGGFFER